jgi:hypothetical protein
VFAPLPCTKPVMMQSKEGASPTLTKPKQPAIKLNRRQRALLLAGLELLRKQLASGLEETPDGTLLSAKQLGELAAIVGDNWDGAASSHKHAIDGRRHHSYSVAGECSVHGMICVACEIKWHLEDGPLDWCRECDRVLAGGEELAQSRIAKTGTEGRRRRKAKRR